MKNILLAGIAFTIICCQSAIEKEANREKEFQEWLDSNKIIQESKRNTEKLKRETDSLYLELHYLKNKGKRGIEVVGKKWKAGSTYRHHLRVSN